MHAFFLTAIASLVCLCSASPAQETFSLKDTAGQHLDVLRGGVVAARFMYAHDTATKESREASYKPYLHVFDPTGAYPITKGPGGEFTHHRGLFIGWNKISVAGKMYDRWHMKGGDQVHQKFSGQATGNGAASFTSEVKWMDDKDSPLLEEARMISVSNGPKPAWLQVDMASTLKPAGAAVTLDGDPEHAGLQFRPANEVDRTATSYLYPKSSADPHKDCDYPWFGETFSLNEKKFSVVYLNHPDNPKDAPISAYRDYGRFGAFFRAEIPAGKELTIQARLLFFEGDLPEPAVIQKAANAYTKRDDPVPAVTAKPAEGKAAAQQKKTPAAAKPSAPSKP